MRAHNSANACGAISMGRSFSAVAVSSSAYYNGETYAKITCDLNRSMRAKNASAAPQEYPRDVSADTALSLRARVFTLLPVARTPFMFSRNSEKSQSRLCTRVMHFEIKFNVV